MRALLRYPDTTKTDLTGTDQPHFCEENMGSFWGSPHVRNRLHFVCHPRIEVGHFQEDFRLAGPLRSMLFFCLGHGSIRSDRVGRKDMGKHIILNVG